MSTSSPAVPVAVAPGLSRWQRWGLVALVVVLLLFGAVVEHRSAFLTQHMTDLQVYLRAAWAVRSGADYYTITDDHGWHYHYPPLLAILMMPLADPPPGTEASGLTVPFAVTVGLWYVFSLVFLAVGVHWLANALEETSPSAELRNPPWGCRRWWALRVLPMLACAPAIGGTLARGQVNLLLLAVMCGMLAAAVRGRSVQAGLWLAVAICLKVFPAFLLVYPLWRRDTRWLLGSAAGLAIGMGVLPALVVGPQQTVDRYREWLQVLAQPALAGGGDHARDVELIGATATDSQSFEILLHNLTNLNRDTRPHEPALWTRVGHWLLGALLTGLTLLAIGRQPARQAAGLGLNGLVLLMLLLSPVCHLHYFCLALPLVMTFLLIAWGEGRGDIAPVLPGVFSGPPASRGLYGALLVPALVLLVLVNFVANLLPHIPGLEMTRDVGLASGGTLVLWLGAVVLLRIQRGSEAASAGGGA